MIVTTDGSFAALVRTPVSTVFLPNPDYDYTEYVAGVVPYVCTAPADTAEMKITTEVRLDIISDKCVDTTVSPWQVRDSRV